MRHHASDSDLSLVRANCFFRPTESIGQNSVTGIQQMLLCKVIYFQDELAFIQPIYGRIHYT
jgi:hypothetical protein